MSERTVKLSLRLNVKEYEHLKKQAQIAGLKMEPFVRHLIMGVTLYPRQPEEYKKILFQLSAIGNSVNQIAHIANLQRYVSTTKINEAVTLVDKAISAVREWK